MSSSTFIKLTLITSTLTNTTWYVQRRNIILTFVIPISIFPKKPTGLWGQWGQTVRDNCACMICAHTDNWMVPGRELITPVGAPLEVVEDSAEKKNEEGGST